MTKILLTAVANAVFFIHIYAYATINAHPWTATATTTATAIATVRRTGAGCPTPSLTLNGSAVVARKNAAPDYSTLSEIKFTARMPSPFAPAPAPAPAKATASAKSQNRLCKIKCVAGEWVGPLCKTEQNTEDEGRFHPILRSCKLDLNDTNLALLYDGALLKRWKGRIPDRSKITIRCDGAPGLYKLDGNANLRCSDGDWNYALPRCLPTTSISGYSEYSPPTIRVKLAVGDSAIDYRNNHVVVYPGSIVHLECLFRRHYGNVRWTWMTTATANANANANAHHQHTQSNHLTGWSIAADEREWIYRLSLYYVKAEYDSGNYTCVTPRNHNNSVTLRVEAIQCEKRSENDNVYVFAANKHDAASTWKTQAGNHVVGRTIEYTCPMGFTMIGSNRSTCLADGKWSSKVPRCERIVCVPISTAANVHLIVSANNNTYGSTISFRCAWGYALKGAKQIRCNVNGLWSSSVPKCVDILCPPPAIPYNGYLLEKSNGENYRVGSVIQFACKKPYRLAGEESIVCEESGVWSAASPTCKRVCEYPGEPVNGRLVPQKFWYETGDRLKVFCDDGYVATESESTVVVSCTVNGTWSTELPGCVNYTQI